LLLLVVFVFSERKWQMSKAALLKRLDELHLELNGIKEVDAEALEALQRVARDIRQLVEGQSEPAPPETLGSAVRERLEQLESEHPVVTRFLSQMTDFLGLMGI
jgi:ABC-type transporter Mla MlaB component